MIAGDSLRLGQLVPGDSLLHRLDPRTKLLSGILMTAGLFAVNTYPSLLALAFAAVLLCGLSRLPRSGIIRSLKPILLTVIGISFLHVFAGPGPYLVEVGPLKLSEPGLITAGKVDLRLASVMVIAALMAWTTSPMAMADGVERLLAPLARLGIPVAELATMVGIAFRFAPTCASELERIMKAQAARGVDFSQGGPFRRARELAPLVIPLIVATMERGEELALAMESRCYPGKERSRFRQLQMTVLDLGVLVCCLSLVGGLVLVLQ